MKKALKTLGAILLLNVVLFCFFTPTTSAFYYELVLDCDCSIAGPGDYIGPECKMQSLPGPCPGGGWGMFSNCVKDNELNMCNCDNEGDDC